MDVISSSNFYVLSLLFLLPYVYLFRHSLFLTSVRIPESNGLLRPFLTLLVIGHTLYTLRLLLSPPVNLFTLLNLPLTAPVSAIRVALLEYQKDQYPVGFQNKIAPDVQTLLTRLSSFEARVIYVRYGPYPLSECKPCVHLTDFAIFALAPTVLPYLYTLILVSFVTSYPVSRSEWRMPSLVVLAATFFTEIWWTLDGTVQFQDGRLTGWTHTHIYLARYAVLLLLPLLVHHLPAHSSLSALPPFIVFPPSRPAFPHQSSDFHLMNGGPVPQTPQRGNPQLSRSHSTPVFSQAGPSTPNGTAHTQQPTTPFSTLNGTLSSLNTTINTLRILEWTRLAGLRRRDLRDQMSDYHAIADMNAQYARSDEGLRRDAERLGMGYQNGKERAGSSPRPRFGGKRTTWKGKGDPRGLDGDNIIEEDEADDVNGGEGEGSSDERRQERKKLEEEAELAQSPLRVMARQAAKEIATNYFVGTRSGTG